MCTIKTGTAIETQADVRNLVLAIILRQRGLFEENNVQSLARDYLTESSYSVSQYELHGIISNYLDLLCRNQELSRRGEKYISRSIYNVGS